MLGRFISADSIVPQPGNPQSLNRYAYVLNNPLRYTDPSGHWVETAWDIFSIGLTLNDIRQEGLTWQNGLALAVDVTTAILPGVPAFAGVLMKGGKAAVEVASHADEVADAARVLSHADEAADAARAANITKASIIADLSTGTTQSRRIAQAMEEGKIGVNILGEEMFEKAYRFRGGTGSAAGVDAFAYGRQIYLRRSSADIFRDAVHEGTHALDYRSGFQGAVAQWEKRAYFFERQFQLFKGRYTEFKTLNDILQHIKRAH